MSQTETICPLPEDVFAALHNWFAEFDPAVSRPLSRGYQGKVWLFEHPAKKLVIKTAPDHGVAKKILGFALKREYQVYTRLAGLTGVPCCYGFFNNRFLVLEFIDGESLRKGEPEDRDYFYKRLLDLITALHARGVAHVDLKRKNNILVVNGREPYLVDFGVAVLQPEKHNSLKNYFFSIGKRFDFNAWIKHKYKRRYETVSEADRVYLHITGVEKFSRTVKRALRRVIKKSRK